MDDLMNKVGALIEAHVKSEVEARALIHSIQIKECQARECSCPSKDEIRRGARALGFWEKLVETLCVGPADEATFDNVMAKIRKLRWNACFEKERADGNFDAWGKAKAERDKYRVMWEQLHRAQGEDLDAQEQLKELLSTIGLAHFDRSTIKGAIELTRKRDARLVSERDDAKAQLEVALNDLRRLRVTIQAERDVADKACAERDVAEKSYHALVDKVRDLEAKLLEVRKAVSEKAPVESAKAPTKPSEFQVGDLVARHMRGLGCWGVITKACGSQGVEVFYENEGRSFMHLENSLTRKPIEKGDRVRCVSGTFKERSGTVEQMNNIQCCVTRNSGAFWTETSTLVAIAP